MAKRITSDEGQADEKLAEWLAQVRMVRKARADLLPLIAKMPWWAQPGPTSLHADGTMSGGMSWVPAIHDVRPPETTNMAITTLIRPTETDYRRRFEVDPFGRQPDRDMRLAATLDRLKQRYLAQDREQKAAGVWKARERLRKLDLIAFRIEHWFDALPPSPTRIAASYVFTIGRHAVPDVCFSRQSEARCLIDVYDYGKVLANLVPVLPPLVASTAARIIKPGGGLIRHMPIWIGECERDPKHGFGQRPLDVASASDDLQVAA